MTEVPSEPTTREQNDEADRLMAMVHNPLWVFSRHPRDIAVRKFIGELVDAGFTIVKRVEVGPSPEQIDAAAKAMYNDRMVTHYRSDAGLYDTWEQFAEKYTQAAENDRRQARVMLVAACSVKSE